MSSSHVRTYYNFALKITPFKALLQHDSHLPPTLLDKTKWMELLQTHAISMA